MKHPLGELDPARLAKHLIVFRPSDAVLEQVVLEAQRNIPGITSVDVVRKVVAHNPDSLWAISRKRRFDPENPVGEGFLAILFLNNSGLRQLAANVLDTANPDPALLAKRGEKPAGIYVWAIYAPGMLAAGATLVLEQVNVAPYAGVDIFTRPNTEDGRKFNEVLGLKKGAKIGAVLARHLYVFPRAKQDYTKAPLYDSYHKDLARRDAEHKDHTSRELTVTVARSFEDLMRVVSMRSAVYISEQECPYEEEFDGNDLTGTHLLGYVGDEPAGCLRIRFFADFAKIERLAVRREFRHTRLAFQLVRAGIELCRVKGYRKLYGHAQKRLVNFWSRFGFHELEGGQELVFSDFDYVEMVAEIDQHPDAIAIGVDPYVIIRPEGRWHLPGVLEHSSDRSASRPSVDRSTS